LREVSDEVEQEGIRRAKEEISRADRVLWVFDGSIQDSPQMPVDDSLPSHVPVTLVRNKIDLTGSPPGERQTTDGTEIALAARSGEGLHTLREHLKSCVGYQGAQEGEYMARRRHLDALRRVQESLANGRAALQGSAAGELLAEDLRQSQQALSEITGEFLPDDLLGEIFGRFCIGK